MQETVSDIFSALAHPTRRQILQDLRDGERAAGDIAARFPASGPTISRHLSVLRAAGLVTERREANRILYSLVGDRLALSVGEFLSTVCPEQIVLRSIRKPAKKAKSGGTKPAAAKSAGAGAAASRAPSKAAGTKAAASRTAPSKALASKAPKSSKAVTA